MFLSSLSSYEIGRQIAGLLNDFNHLGSKRSAHDVCRSRTDYIVETNGLYVAGAIGVDRQSYTFTELKHLVVHPRYRKQGIAKYLIEQAVNTVDTKMLFVTVREDNHPSLNLFTSLGFVRGGGYEAEEHKVILLVRMSPKWEKKEPLWKLGLLSGTMNE